MPAPIKIVLLHLLLIFMLLRSSCTFVVRSYNSYIPWRLASSSSSSSDLDDLLDSVLHDDALEKARNSTTSKWKTLDWKKLSEAVTHPDVLPASPVDVILVRDRIVHVKRDDQLRLPGSFVSGNKARKMFSLNQLTVDDFPQCLVSYGGPQSNAMLALAAVVHFHNQRCTGAQPKRFLYYTKKLPRFLRNQPSGNLFRACLLGMELIELSHDEYHRLFGGDWGGNQEPPASLEPPCPGNSVWVPQGGASAMAVGGTKQLGREIVDYWRAQCRDGAPLSVCVPGGTCSTALLLHKTLQELVEGNKALDIRVVVVPCVGDEGYARRQMMSLNVQLGFPSDDIPIVLPPTPSLAAFGQAPKKFASYFPFGEPDAEILSAFRQMDDEHEVVLDLLYGAPSWAIMLRHWRVQARQDGLLDTDSPLAGRQVMYVHSGGLEGINTQLLRYSYNGLIDSDDIQLPGRS